MIIAQKSQGEIKTTGLEETVKMNISESQEVQSHIIRVLTETYKYPIQSLVREQFCNHLDSHIEVEKIDIHIPVKLYENATGNYTFETSDEGLGLSEEEFYKYYMGIGESSKRNKPNLIGGYGLGCKCPLSYTSSYEVICRKNGIECKFLVFKGDERPECTKIYRKKTSDLNGVTVKVSVDYNDFDDFQDAIKEQLCYFPMAHIQIEGDDFNYNSAQIFQNELFEWSEVYPNSELHISFGGVHYSVDWKLLKIPAISIPIAIKIPIDSGVTPEFNRESLNYTAFVKSYIHEKIKQVANYFVDKYNENWKEYDSILNAWEEIPKTDRIVKIGNVDFSINGIIQYADRSCNGLKIKGIELEIPKYYRELSSHIFDEYETIAKFDTYRDKWRIKHIKYDLSPGKILGNWKVILVDSVPVGKLKRYFLEEKYSGKDIFFIKKESTRKLGDRTDDYRYRKDQDYRYLLNLTVKPKKDWRNLIKEWQFVENQFKSLIIDETGCSNTTEYQAWYIKEKELAKQNRGSGNSNYKVLNKEKGQVTIAMAREKSIGSGVCFEKQVFNITGMHKTNTVTILFTEEEKERAKNYFNLLKTKFRVGIIGKNEFKKVKGLHNMVTEEEFQKTKVFRRIVTSVLYDDLINQFNAIYDRDDIQILKDLVQPFYDDIQILVEYVSKNAKRIDNELLIELMELAKTNNLYDFQYMDIYNKVKSGIEKYKFISLLETPKRYDKEEKKMIKSLIGQILYHQKMYKGLHEDLEITVKNSKVTENSLEYQEA